jgi:hypothetical protein
VSSLHGYKRCSWVGRPIVALLRRSMAGEPQFSPSHSYLHTLFLLYSTRNFFLLEVMCDSSSVLSGTNQLCRFFCSVRNKPRSLCSMWVCSARNKPQSLCSSWGSTLSHHPSPHFLGEKHREFYVSLHGLTFSYFYWKSIPP